MVVPDQSRSTINRVKDFYPFFSRKELTPWQPVRRGGQALCLFVSLPFLKKNKNI